MDAGNIIFVLAIVAAFYMAWCIGANDVANVMGTSVGSGALGIKRAVLIAAIFEFFGAFLVGDQVTNTIRKGIVDPDLFSGEPLFFAAGMTAALFATAIWLQIASAKGLPVSTTHSIVGAVIGFGIVGADFDAVNWWGLSGIAISWVISPITGGLIAFLLFYLIRKYVLDSTAPIKAMKSWVPFLLFSAVFLMSTIFFKKTLGKVGHDVGMQEALFFAFILAGVFAFVAFILVRRLEDKQLSRDELLKKVENVFAKMQWVTACFLALAHGSNDVANAIGPAAAVVSVLGKGSMTQTADVPLWLLLLGAAGIVIGLSTYGRRVIATVGKSITEITPTRGFSAEFGSAFTILLGSILGMPLSSTQVLVGAVIGVGLARGIAGLNMNVIRKIMGSWLITIPATAFISGVFCWFLKFIF